MPENLNIIEDRAFSGCRSISKIVIPKSCQNIGEYAFLDCDSLNTLTLNGEHTTLGTKSFGYEYDNGYAVKDGFLLISQNENAIRYAEENHIQILSEIISGDGNADGVCNLADVVLLQKWLLNIPETKLINWKAVDCNEDNQLDIIDLCLLKKNCLQQNKKNGLRYSSEVRFFLQ